MHSLESLSSDIAALLKSRGDSGGTGDKSKISLRHRDNFVPTATDTLSPPTNGWGHDRPASGDAKCDILHALNKAAPTVPTVPTIFKRDRAESLASEIPDEWNAILDELIALDLPDWASPQRWQNVVSDAAAFLAPWEATADRLGWSALDLFGVHPDVPGARYDVMGLLLLIQGGVVVVMTSDTATIRRPSGSILTYRKSDMTGAVLVTECRQ